MKKVDIFEEMLSSNVIDVIYEEADLSHADYKKKMNINQDDYSQDNYEYHLLKSAFKHGYIRALLDINND